MWFFFINEQLLRFLNLRYPHDYNTVPRLYFWIFHLVWLFPWSVYFPAVAKLSFKPVDRAGQTRLLALCWAGFILVFFTFSTTQEYYSMPAYPALALLIGSAMAMGGKWVKWGTRALCVISACAAAAVFAILVHVHGIATPGDISSALSRHPKAYTLSLGHMEDLTLDSFAYLRVPLVMAGIAFLVGVIGTFQAKAHRAFWAAALDDGHILSGGEASYGGLRSLLVIAISRKCADVERPEGQLIAEGFYYQFSSVFFYTNRTGLLLSTRKANLEYGANAPDAPQVFIDDSQFKGLWMAPGRDYLLTFASALPRYEELVAPARLVTVAKSGGKVLLTNHPLEKPDISTY